jgi:hypothetical protein
MVRVAKNPTVADGTYRKNYQKARDRPNNIWFTPPSAVDFVYPYIQRYAKIWEPCCGQGHIVKYLEAKGHEVIGTDILMGETYDFKTYAPADDAYDVIVTNPPFEGKRQTLERLYALGKPFAILMPTMALDSNPVRALIKDHGQWGIVMPNKTINYIPGDLKHETTPPKNSRSFFHSSWFCWKIPGVEGMIIL